MTFAKSFISESIEILESLDTEAIEDCVQVLNAVRRSGGRLFIIGVGGSAANASHAVNDFRKICGIEAYAPTDNVAELTARANDDGWVSTFAGWLDTSRFTEYDGLLVFSVGGGSSTVSANIVAALDLAIEVGAAVVGVVGRDGGYTAEVTSACVVVPPLFENHITPHTESIASLISHLFVSHPLLAR